MPVYGNILSDVADVKIFVLRPTLDFYYVSLSSLLHCSRMHLAFFYSTDCGKQNMFKSMQTLQGTLFLITLAAVTIAKYVFSNERKSKTNELVNKYTNLGASFLPIPTRFLLNPHPFHVAETLGNIREKVNDKFQ